MSLILIVEDDPAILTGLRANLEFEDHEVLSATDGEAGYRMLQEHSPDLVILDWMLPKLNGPALCRRVRGEGFGAPILMLSAKSQEADRIQGLDYGANDYVSKPFSLKELLARVRALLRHEREHHENENKMARELEMAAKVQAGLLPRVQPPIPGLDYAGLCRPARGVSGDYYDFLPLGEGRLGLLVADVSGKGMPAALLGASLHAAVRANAAQYGDRCGELLARVNAQLFETTSAEGYATVFYGVYDAAARELRYANAGHCAPLLLRGGECLQLDSLTPPVGLFAALQPAEARARLEPGDCLAIFSDGALEASADGMEQFGEDRLLRTLRAQHESGAATMCAALIQAVTEYAGAAQQPDDITVVALRLN